MATVPNNVLTMPDRPNDVRTAVQKDFTKEYVTSNGYTLNQNRLLGLTVDDVEMHVDLETYERMENESTISQGKRILLTNVLADELQFAPGATEDEVDASEYELFEQVMAFCQRVIAGLEKPYRSTLEQLTGNGIRYGHGIAEIEWEYRLDGSLEAPPKNKTPAKQKTRIGAAFSNMFSRLNFSSLAEQPPTGPSDESSDKTSPKPERPNLTGQKVRLMPSGIKVKPRGAARFVVDDYMNVLGMAPRFAGRTLRWDQIVDRRKFMVLTMSQQDEDPRGRSMYRPAFNWYNLKQQMPTELLRFILEEIVPKAVGKLPPGSVPFQIVRDENGNTVYEDDEKLYPKLESAAESFNRLIAGFRGGSGAVIPDGAALEPFKKFAGDARMFVDVINILDRQMERPILLQSLAQSEGEHQARSASETHKEVLNSLTFWIRWLLAMCTLTDLCETAVRINLGEWALAYMPQISLGDFVRRDWARDVEVIAKAYFQGFLDDSQRPEIMSWLNFPKAGQSRQELMAEMDPTNGEPVMPNKNRPDKQGANKGRNNGNGTEKEKNGNTANIGRSTLDVLGNHRGRFASTARTLLYGRNKGH